MYIINKSEAFTLTDRLLLNISEQLGEIIKRIDEPEQKTVISGPEEKVKVEIVPSEKPVRTPKTTSKPKKKSEPKPKSAK